MLERKSKHMLDEAKMTAQSLVEDSVAFAYERASNTWAEGETKAYGSETGGDDRL